MVFRLGTDDAKLEYSVATLPPSKVHVCESPGEIPPNLADISMLIIEAHRANGDLAWLSDMIREAETSDRPQPELDPVKRVVLSYLTVPAIDDMLKSDTMPDDCRKLLQEYRVAVG